MLLLLGFAYRPFERQKHRRPGISYVRLIRERHVNLRGRAGPRQKLGVVQVCPPAEVPQPLRPGWEVLEVLGLRVQSRLIVRHLHGRLGPLRRHGRRGRRGGRGIARRRRCGPAAGVPTACSCWHRPGGSTARGGWRRPVP